MPKPLLDRSEVIRILFHPRRDYGSAYSTQNIRLIDVEVEPGIVIGGRLYPAEATAPAILYFHGNGEIAADYDNIAPLYTQMGISLLVMDYRGYGRSTGNHTATALLSDAVSVYDSTRNLLEENGLAPSHLYVMGRSLGSAAAIEIALHEGQHIDGLIIESGFSDTFALLARIGGLQIRNVDEVTDGFGNLSKISRITTRTLIIHGENDVLIPSEEGKQLYEECVSSEKQLVIIAGAGHNDIMYVGKDKYFQAISDFVHLEEESH